MHAEDNITLTRTGSDTPMGRLFRRFWMPALLSAELPAPDAPPVRVRLLGEDLVAFRDSAGRVGLLDAFCPHRRAELYLGRNEEAGLRCVYHGWKFNVDGRCVDMPGEDNGCELAKRVSTLAYPVMERGGVVWAWMGPREERPGLPEFEFCRVSPDHVYISKCLMKCNYLQALEGSIDYSHISFLHKEVEGAAARADVFGIGGLIRFANEDVRPTLFATRTDYGLRIAARRSAGADAYFWRVARWLMPCFVIVPTEPGNVCRANLFVPIDDENCWWYRIRWHQDRPLTAREVDGYAHDAYDYAELRPGTYEPRGTRENDYLMDRQAQRSASFTGIPSAQLQDLAVQESQGRIHDRSRERLMKTDMPIVQCRRILLQSARELLDGVLPAAATRPEAYRGRAYATTQPRALDLEQTLEALRFDA